MTEAEIKKGLAGVVVDYTAVSKVNPDTNSLLYRGYPVQELAATAPSRRSPTCSGTASCPTADELADFTAARARRPRASIPWSKQVIDAAAARRRTRWTSAHRASRDRRADPSWPRTPRREANLAKAVRPVRAAAGDRRLRPAPPPRPGPRRAARRPRLLGELPVDDLRRGARPRGRGRVQRVDDPVRRALVQRVHVHRARRSRPRSPTCTRPSPARSARSRVRCTAAPTRPSCTSSTRSASGRGIARGAAARQAWLDDALAEKRKIMGFGHRVYKHGDSRVPTMKAALDTLVEHYDRPELLGALRRRSSQRWSSARASSRTSTTRRARLPPDGLRHRDLHAAVRREPDHRLDGAHHGAAGSRTP